MIATKKREKTRKKVSRKQSSKRFSFCAFLRFFAAIYFGAFVFVNDAISQDAKRLNLAVLDFGDTVTGGRATEKLFAFLSKEKDFALVDRDLSRAAARGVGYTGSLNLSLEEARDLGAAVGCEFFITGDAQTIRRSPSSGTHYESYASVFIVSARTGRLILWERPSFQSPGPEEAEKLLLNEVVRLASRYAEKIRQAQKTETDERVLSVGRSVLVIEEVPEDGTPESEGFRPPQPYRRIRPPYPETAARADAEATVDALVDLDQQGEVMKVEVVRWAGFGLDDEIVKTVKQMHFRPAMRDGKPFPIRILLRYNFRRPKQ
jgi:TonB family protein